MTGFKEAAVERALAAGAVALLHKPFRTGRLDQDHPPEQLGLPGFWIRLGRRQNAAAPQISIFQRLHEFAADYYHLSGPFW